MKTIHDDRDNGRGEGIRRMVFASREREIGVCDDDEFLREFRSDFHLLLRLLLRRAEDCRDAFRWRFRFRFRIRLNASLF